MSVLRNFRQKAFDFEVLRQQAALKAESAAERRADEAREHERMLAQLAAAHAEEDGKAEAQRAKAHALQAERTATLRAVIERRLQEMKGLEEGLARQNAEIAERAQGDRERAEAQKAVGAVRLRELQAENARLRALREEQKKGEAEAAVWIVAQAAAKDAQNALVKQIIQRGRDEAAKKAAVISDLMARDLASRANTEDARLDSQVAEKDAKDAERAAARAAMQAEMRESIAADIARVKARVLQAVRDRMAEDAKEDAVFVAKLAALKAKEDEAAALIRERALATKKEAMAMAAERAAKRSAEREETLAAERAAMAKLRMGEDDAGFVAEAARIREEEAAKPAAISLLQPFNRLIHKTLNRPLQSN
jgi:hypothetical protein